MKKLYIAMFAMMMALVCVGFTSCGSDDDDNGVSGTVTNLKAEQLTGTWETYHVKIWGKQDGQSVSGESDITSKGDVERFEFGSDGNLQMYYYENGKWVKDGSGYRYVIEGSYLLIYHGHSSYPSHDFLVNKINTSELVVTEHKVDEKDGDDYYLQYYMKRVN